MHDEEIAFLLRHQNQSISLALVPPGTVAKALGLTLPVSIIYVADCDECDEPNDLPPDSTSFTCKVCRHEHPFINPDGRIEIGTLMTAAEMAESLQKLLVGAGCPPEALQVEGDVVKAGLYRYQMATSDVGLQEVFRLLDTDQVPITLVSAGRVLNEARFHSARLYTEVRLIEFRHFFDPAFLTAEAARIGKAEPEAIPQKRWSQLERQNPILQRGYVALRPLSGLRSLTAEMELYLQGNTERLPELFGRPEQPYLFCEYWVHFWLKVMALYAYKLGLGAKAAGLINPPWPDGLFFLPKNKQFKAATTYLYDITTGDDYAHELHQAVRYIRWYSEIGVAEYYYVITKEPVSEGKKAGLRSEWLRLCKENQIEGVQAVFLSMGAMNKALQMLLELPDFWEPLYCFELEGVLNRAEGLFAYEYANGGDPMFITEEELVAWATRTRNRAKNGQISGVREYETLVNDYGFMLQSKLPDPDWQAN